MHGSLKVVRGIAVLGTMFLIRGIGENLSPMGVSEAFAKPSKTNFDENVRVRHKTL